MEILLAEYLDKAFFWYNGREEVIDDQSVHFTLWRFHLNFK